jgi:hypothetical protein
MAIDDQADLKVGLYATARGDAPLSFQAKSPNRNVEADLQVGLRRPL